MIKLTGEVCRGLPYYTAKNTQKYQQNQQQQQHQSKCKYDMVIISAKMCPLLARERRAREAIRFYTGVYRIRNRRLVRSPLHSTNIPCKKRRSNTDNIPIPLCGMARSWCSSNSVTAGYDCPNPRETAFSSAPFTCTLQVGIVPFWFTNWLFVSLMKAVEAWPDCRLLSQKNRGKKLTDWV